MSTLSNNGTEGTAQVFALMRAHGVARCPTLAATDAVARYRGWNGREPASPEVLQARHAFALARAAYVTMLRGGDIGVSPHGENARELECWSQSGCLPPMP